MSPAAVLLFAKAPEPGRVNTRLIPALGEQGAARLHSEMVRWKAAELVRTGRPLQLWVTGAHPLFNELAEQFEAQLFLQSGRDLGERMQRALAHALRQAPAAVLMGSDCPSLPGSTVENAIERLTDRAADAVLVPAEDGGFGLVAVTRSEPALFGGIPWGTSAVLSLTRRHLRTLGWRWSELGPCWDVDRPEDLIRLQRFTGTPPAIRRLLENAGSGVLE